MIVAAQTSVKCLHGLLAIALGLLVLVGALQPIPAGAIEVELKSRLVRRDVLALYDSRHEASPTYSRIHRMAEMPLNFFGYKLVYRDVNAPLPTAGELEGYRAILSWLVEPLADAPGYARWLDQATASGLRLIVLGEAVPGVGGLSDAPTRRIYERLGLKLTDQFVAVTNASAPVVLDTAMIGFERALDKALPPFPVFEPLSSATRVHLALSFNAEGAPGQSAVVATNAGGGFAAEGFTIFYDPVTDRARWVLNPFDFFKTALGDDVFPVPDVTTLDGRRMYFSHIDGDGWNNISEIENYREAQTTATDVVREQLIEPYPDLPVSVGLIAGDVMPALGGTKAAAESARRLFALPQVEVASHTYTHPFAWGFFETYDRAKELALIEHGSKPSPALMDRMRAFLSRMTGRVERSDVQGYVAGSADLPRGYLKEPFDVVREVHEALAVSESLAPPGKKAAIYLWSGDTEPFEAAIRETRKAGVRNMNGGDTRLDAEYPSHFYVPPIARPVGAERQIYAANSNENTYTNNWHGPFFGQILLRDTLTATESPRRLKPFNLYYHMYSGEKPGALSALKALLDDARRAAVIPVKASEYAAIADDFFAVEMEEVGQRTWRIAKRGAMQTFRFDSASAVDVDWVNSVGLLGANRHNGALYVALDPASADAAIALRAAGEGAGSPPPLHLVESRWQLRNLSRRACDFTVDAQGFGPGEMVWQTPLRIAQRYVVSATRGGRLLEQAHAVTAEDGRLRVTVAADAREPVALTFACLNEEGP